MEFQILPYMRADTMGMDYSWLLNVFLFDY